MKSTIAISASRLDDAASFMGKADLTWLAEITPRPSGRSGALTNPKPCATPVGSPASVQSCLQNLLFSPRGGRTDPQNPDFSPRCARLALKRLSFYPEAAASTLKNRFLHPGAAAPSLNGCRLTPVAPPRPQTTVVLPRGRAPGVKKASFSPGFSQISVKQRSKTQNH
jgi:hypothetical protein